uniref:Zinc finger protein ZPR1 n=1 Tax=Lygus hesperus TaxID=30085 RepID=A0A0A9YEH3_LYGHE
MYTGDSNTKDTAALYDEHLQRLRELLTVSKPFTFILDDPSGNSFIEGRCEGKRNMDPKTDPQICVENYTRDAKHNALLGIDTMCTENYDTTTTTTNTDTTVPYCDDKAPQYTSTHTNSPHYDDTVQQYTNTYEK